MQLSHCTGGASDVGLLGRVKEFLHGTLPSSGTAGAPTAVTFMRERFTYLPLNSRTGQRLHPKDCGARPLCMQVKADLFRNLVFAQPGFSYSCA